MLIIRIFHISRHNSYKIVVPFLLYSSFKWQILSCGCFLRVNRCRTPNAINLRTVNIMKKKYLIGGLVFIALLGALFILFHKFSKINEDVALRNKIVETLKQSNKIEFSKLTDFPWDTMYIFTPYSKPENILKTDGISSYDSNFNIELLDNINMIAFVKANKLVAFIELPRNYGGADLTKYVIFSKEETNFNVSQENKTIIFSEK